MARPQYLVSTHRLSPTYRRKRIKEFLIATEPGNLVSIECGRPQRTSESGHPAKSVAGELGRAFFLERGKSLAHVVAVFV
jgi:hypothetical protein